MFREIGKKMVLQVFPDSDKVIEERLSSLKPIKLVENPYKNDTEQKKKDCKC
jgi:hypothetical protein